MKIVCIARNYVAHAKELDNEVPSEPAFFLKPATAMFRTNSKFFIPDFTNQLEHEVEVVLRIM
jgi:2-keto-4-pentenoate hydratase/2-oxohepta-3-ene-1,7-dioic acid hydratase (catechol pathway)